MSLGALTVLEKIDAQGPVFHIRCSIVGDGAYPAGGSAGLLAKLRAALNLPGLNIIEVDDQSAPGASLNRLEYDHTNDKLFARVKTTGVESAVADQSAVTYGLYVVAY